jgi:hypothetical protein
MTLLIISLTVIAALFFLSAISFATPSHKNKDVVFIDVNTGNVISDNNNTEAHMFDDYSSFSRDYGTVASIFEEDMFDDM